MRQSVFTLSCIQYCSYIKWVSFCFLTNIDWSNGKITPILYNYNTAYYKLVVAYSIPSEAYNFLLNFWFRLLTARQWKLMKSCMHSSRIDRVNIKRYGCGIYVSFNTSGVIHMGWNLVPLHDIGILHSVFHWDLLARRGNLSPEGSTFALSGTPASTPVQILPKNNIRVGPWVLSFRHIHKTDLND